MSNRNPKLPPKAFMVLYPPALSGIVTTAVFLRYPYGMLKPTALTDAERARAIDMAIAYGSGLAVMLILAGFCTAVPVWRAIVTFRSRGSEKS